jgi:membrane associated rhomboid family serine protease
LRPPERWNGARATLAISAVTAAAWLLAKGLGLGAGLVYWAGFIPTRFGDAPSAGLPVVLTPLTATLLHGNFLHLLFNLLILLFCGRSVENILGARGLVILYLVGAFAAAAAHYAVDPADTAAVIGASGAISAVLGAYALLFGRNRVKVASPTLALWLHAAWLAAAWVGLQLLVGFTFTTQGVGIAIAAHVGGFLAGLLLAKPLLMLRWRGA